MISECFQACVRSVAVSPPCPCVRSFGAGFGVGLGVAPAPLHVSLEMPALTVSRRLTLLGAGRLGGVGPPTTEQVQGSASERTWAGVQQEEAEVAGGLLVLPAPVPPASSLGPSRCPGWRRRVWGRCCSHGATDWAPTLPLKAPTVRQEHCPWTALIQTREASVNRLKREGRNGPALLGPRLPRTPVPRSPALPLPLTAGLGQQVGCGLWVGRGSVWPW